MPSSWRPVHSVSGSGYAPAEHTASARVWRECTYSLCHCVVISSGRSMSKHRLTGQVSKYRSGSCPSAIAALAGGGLGVSIGSAQPSRHPLWQHWRDRPGIGTAGVLPKLRPAAVGPGLWATQPHAVWQDCATGQRSVGEGF